jgi:hypothetical protein
MDSGGAGVAPLTAWLSATRSVGATLARAPLLSRTEADAGSVLVRCGRP